MTLAALSPRLRTIALPDWIQPQLCSLVTTSPAGSEWLHEIKFDGYRMMARIDGENVKLLTRSGLDWTHKYGPTAQALSTLPVKSAYLDGELCGVRPDGVTSFSMMQAASDTKAADGLVFYVFDLLHLDGEDLTELPLTQRKARLATLLQGCSPAIHYSDDHRGDGEIFRQQACKLSLEGVISKRADKPYRPGNRGLWVKAKCLNREEFVVVGWTDPEGGRGWMGALLLGYYDPSGRLLYAGRVGTGLSDAQLKDLHDRLQVFSTSSMPMEVPPPRKSRFGSPLVLSRVHWVRPEMVVEVTFLTWTADGLLRQVVFQGLREDKPAREVVRALPD